MITEEDFDAAADASAEMAFVRLERKFRAVYEAHLCDSDGNGAYYHYTAEYMNHVIAAARALDVVIFEFGWKIPRENNVFEEYQKFRHVLDTFIVQTTISHIRSGPKDSVTLDESEKSHLRAYAEAIKGVIDNSSLIAAKKDRLYNKINAFIIELDRERMPLQKFHDMVLSLATTGAEAVDKLEPAWKWVRLGAELLGARQETEQQKLPPVPRRLEGPKRHLPSPPKEIKNSLSDMEDDIPF